MNIKRIFMGGIAKVIVVLLIIASLVGAVFCGLKCLYLYVNGFYESEGKYYPWYLIYEEQNKISGVINNTYIAGEIDRQADELINNNSTDNDIEDKTANTDDVSDEYIVENGITFASDTSEDFRNGLAKYNPANSNLRFRIIEEESGRLIAANTTEEIAYEYHDWEWYGYLIAADVAPELKADDIFLENYIKLSGDIPYNWMYFCAMIGFGVAALLFTIYALFQAVYTPDGKLKLSPLERIPVEISLAIDFLVIVGLFYCLIDILESLSYSSVEFIYMVNGITRRDISEFVLYAFIIIAAILLYLLVFRTLRAAVRRIAAGKWYRNTLVYRLLVLIMNIKHFWKWLLFCAVDFFLLVLFIQSRSPSMLTAFMLYNIAAFLYVSYFLIRLGKLSGAAERLADGEDGVRFETTGPLDPAGKSAKIFNRIGDSVSRAVEERMKSERLRTELITNVSHDIKTPLTSIISYVDLIKKEQPENENIRGYIEVLDRQSGRLKKLIEDLIEASKASSGVLPVNAAELDIAELLRQALGEYSERFESASVTAVVNIPDERVVVFADGRHMWRIFDNLSSNICKYSLAGTRAYFDLKVENGEAVMIFRNISSEQSELSGIDLTERFVRRDSSRHTEGSGLGLAIAKSLAELQGASLDVSVDGDLFKVTVRIKCLRVEQPSNMGKSRDMERLSDMEKLSDLEQLSDLENLSDLTDDNGNSSDSPDADGISGSNESDNAKPNTQN